MQQATANALISKQQQQQQRTNGGCGRHQKQGTMPCVHHVYGDTPVCSDKRVTHHDSKCLRVIRSRLGSRCASWNACLAIKEAKSYTTTSSLCGVSCTARSKLDKRRKKKKSKKAPIVSPCMHQQNATTTRPEHVQLGQALHEVVMTEHAGALVHGLEGIARSRNKRSARHKVKQQRGEGAHDVAGVVLLDRG